MLTAAECRISVAEHLGSILLLSVFMGLGWIYFLSVAGLPPLYLASVFSTTLVLAVVLAVFAHEGVHAAVARMLGARKIRVGIFRHGAYVAVENPLPRNRWVAVALAPLAISPIALALASLLDGVLRDMLILTSIINFAGSSGDLLAVAFALTTSRDTLIRDEGAAIVFRGECPDRVLARKLKALALAGLALLLMLTVVLQTLVLVAQLSLPRADKAREILQSTGAVTVDLLGLVEARASLVDTPSGKIITYTAGPKPLFFAVTLLVILVAGYVGWMLEERHAREQK